MKELKYTREDHSTGNYPKTLLIRNHCGGMVWQRYHVRNKKEVEILTSNCNSNGFTATELVDLLDDEETFPNWRDECDWWKEFDNE